MNIDEKELKEYFDLMDERADLFRDNELIPIEKDIEKIRRFTAQTGKKIGVLYHSQYNMLITDLIAPANGSPYVYERIVPNAEGGVVAAAKYNGKFVLIKQFRHSLRNYQYCFVRGYGERGISTEENAAKELSEEIGGVVARSVFLGELSADSGLSSGITSVYLCEVQSVKPKIGYEGIQEIVMLDEQELVQWINDGKINDGFTLAAYALYCAYVKKNGMPF